MKLRNKKTGEIREDSDLGKMLIRYAMPSYDSIAELCEDWEDYKPAEPLIKDEKIRKAVRAWANVNSLKSIQIATIGTTFLRFYGVDRGGYKIVIDFMLESDYYDEFCDKTYTIAELCGEEEE